MDLENPQPSTTRTPEYDITYNFNDITIQTKIFFFLYQGRPSKAKTGEEEQNQKSFLSGWDFSPSQTSRTGRTYQSPNFSLQWD
jgi:hypothetical protein